MVIGYLHKLTHVNIFLLHRSGITDKQKFMQLQLNAFHWCTVSSDSCINQHFKLKILTIFWPLLVMVAC